MSTDVNTKAPGHVAMTDISGFHAQKQHFSVLKPC